MIEYCSKWKVQWDVWRRDKRHTIPEYDLNKLLERLNTVQNDWSGGSSNSGIFNPPSTRCGLLSSTRTLQARFQESYLWADSCQRSSKARRNELRGFL